MPAPKGNKSRLTHGVRSFVETGELPAGTSYIKGKLRQFRAAVEAEVQLANGELSLYQACLIQTACRHETVAQLWQRWLRVEMETLTIDQRLSVTQAIARASKERDAALKELGLNRDERKGAIEALFAPAEPAAAPASGE